MVAPVLVWGVFQIGARVAASAAGRQSIKYVVKKITPKIIEKFGNPLSKHRSLEIAKKAVNKFKLNDKKQQEKF